MSGDFRRLQAILRGIGQHSAVLGSSRRFQQPAEHALSCLRPPKHCQALFEIGRICWGRISVRSPAPDGCRCM
eukprot:1954306-Alexandrium_andersonii.AAC.1